MSALRLPPGDAPPLRLIVPPPPGKQPNDEEPDVLDLEEPECDENGALLPDEPTRAYPGTRAKVKEMMERAKARRAIFHPLDRAYEGRKVTLGFPPE